MTENSTARGPGTPSFTQFISPSQSQSTTPQPPLNQHSAYQAPKPASSDPFAALAGLGSSSASPAPPSQPRTQPKPQPAAANDDDEWSFSSSLPPEPAKPKEFRTVVSSSSVRIEFVAGRSPATPSAMNIHFAFSNTTPQPVGELHFQVAVTKVSSHNYTHPFPPPFTDTYQTGLRAPTTPPNRPRPFPPANPRRHSRRTNLASKRPLPQGRLGQAPLARLIQARQRGTEERDGRHPRVQHCIRMLSPIFSVTPMKRKSRRLEEKVEWIKIKLDRRGFSIVIRAI